MKLIWSKILWLVRTIFFKWWWTRSKWISVDLGGWNLKRIWQAPCPRSWIEPCHTGLLHTRSFPDPPRPLREKDKSSQKNSSPEFWIINLWFGLVFLDYGSGPSFGNLWLWQSMIECGCRSWVIDRKKKHICCWVESVSIPPQNSLAQILKTQPLSNNPRVQRRIHRDDQYIGQTDRDPVGLLKCCSKAERWKMKAFWAIY